MALKRCNKCITGIMVPETEDGQEEWVCINCGNRVPGLGGRPSRLTEIPEIDIPLKPRKRLIGISAKESRRLYRNTPAGKAAWERYRHSELFYEAHARHRKTEKYKDTQARFKEKRRLFKILLNPPRESTCPIDLFRKGPNGEVYNNQERCNLDGNKNCTFLCTNWDIEPKFNKEETNEV